MNVVRVIMKVIEKVAPGLVPKEGKLGDGTLDGPAARRDRAEKGVKEAEDIERRERADRTG